MAKLFIICGHGNGDSGACGNGYQEQERVRVLGKRIKELGGDNVLLGDVNRNYYADNGISKLTIPKEYQIIELHMDSAVPSARGAHVIIYGGYTADKYDKALANFLTGLFPGRSNKIVGRYDLANPKRAAAKGYSYRLVECGFISNAEDVKVFNSNIDNIAKGILQCFDIKVVESSEKDEGVEPYSGYVEVIYNGADGLDVHSTPNFEGNVTATAKKGDVFTVVGRVKVDGVYMYKLKSGLYITSAKEYVSYRTTLHGSTSNPAPALTPIQIEAAANKMKVAIDIPNGSHFWISEHSTVYGGAAYGKPIPSSIKKATTRYTSGGQRFDHGAKWVLAKEIMSWVKTSECLVK